MSGKLKILGIGPYPGFEQQYKRERVIEFQIQLNLARELEREKFIKWLKANQLKP